MVVNVTPAFVAYTANNRGPTPTEPDGREKLDYGLSAVLDGGSVELTLTFLAGAAYCCGEWQCHFLLFRSERWDKLRQVLSAMGVEVAGRLELRVEVIIEEGALFLLPRRSNDTPAALAPSKAHRYRAVVTEGDRPGAEPGAAPGRRGM